MGQIGGVAGKTLLFNRRSIGNYSGEVRFTVQRLSILSKIALARVWQRGTIQIDFNAKAIRAEHVSEDNKRETPVMLHRAIGSFGKIYRYINRKLWGAFLLWLAPNQVGIATISRDQNDYALKVKRN